MKTDYELIQDCLNGETESFGELVERYKNLVYSIILRQTKDPEEANDLSQDVFLKVYRNLDKYSREFKFSTWIMRITGNHIIDVYRKKKFETVTFDEYSESGESEMSPETEYIRREQQARIGKIVAGLPEMYKVPVVLYHRDGLSYNEIAEKIGEPLSKIKNRIFRGRKMLKTLLAETEGF
jgi:RNA polymerase sigma-70 factor (ECF subfamily)